MVYNNFRHQSFLQRVCISKIFHYLSYTITVDPDIRLGNGGSTVRNSLMDESLSEYLIAGNSVFRVTVFSHRGEITFFLANNRLQIRSLNTKYYYETDSVATAAKRAITHKYTQSTIHQSDHSTLALLSLATQKGDKNPIFDREYYSIRLSKYMMCIIRKNSTKSD